MSPAFGPALRQPDQRSCGPSCLVVARMLRDEEYAATVQSRFGEEVLNTHRRVTSAAATRLPWPRALGTPPWAAAREMGRITGTPYRWRLVRWGGADARIREALRAGPVPLYVGSGWLPRHVVLVLAERAGELEIYNPATGGLTGEGRWTTRWFVLGP